MDENDIPQFGQIRQAFINKFRPICRSQTIDMNFGGWSTWARQAHFPKILVTTEREDAILRNTNLPPNVPTFQIGIQRQIRVPFEIRNVQQRGVYAIMLRQ